MGATVGPDQTESGHGALPVPSGQVYMSFADANLPTGEQFLGALILQADTFEDAMTLSHLLGLNPGGEVQGMELPEHIRFRPEDIGRLLNKQEATDLQPIAPN